MSVQVSHVHGDAIGSGRTPVVIGKSEVEDRGLSVTFALLRIRVEGFESVRGWYDSDIEEGVSLLGPALAVLVSVG